MGKYFFFSSAQLNQKQANFSWSDFQDGNGHLPFYLNSVISQLLTPIQLARSSFDTLGAFCTPRWSNHTYLRSRRKAIWGIRDVHCVKHICTIYLTQAFSWWIMWLHCTYSLKSCDLQCSCLLKVPGSRHPAVLLRAAAVRGGEEQASTMLRFAAHVPCLAGDPGAAHVPAGLRSRRHSEPRVSCSLFPAGRMVHEYKVLCRYPAVSIRAAMI